MRQDNEFSQSDSVTRTESTGNKVSVNINRESTVAMCFTNQRAMQLGADGISLDSHTSYHLTSRADESLPNVTKKHHFRLKQLSIQSYNYGLNQKITFGDSASRRTSAAVGGFAGSGGGSHGL